MSNKHRESRHQREHAACDSIERGKLKHGIDTISVQTFRTGERPPPPEKRARRRPLSPAREPFQPIASTPVETEREKAKDKLLAFVAEMSKPEQEKDPKPKYSEPEKPMTEADKRG